MNNIYLVALVLSIGYVDFVLSNPLSNLNPFIVGGVPADISDYPHHLAMLLNGFYLCGASIISRTFALSAAHCLNRGVNPSVVDLWGGSTSRLTGGHLFPVIRFTLHPKYDDITWDYDVMVLEVSRAFENFPFLEPVPLPSPCLTECCDVCPPTTVRIAGWGIFNMETGQIPINLQEITQNIMSNEECNLQWDKEITDRMFCVRIDLGIDSCDGDSGSAAMLRKERQVGLVSTGSSFCGDGSKPAIYTRIENVEIRDFIRDISNV